MKFDEICGGVLVENASDDFPQQTKLENLLPNFAGSSPPIFAEKLRQLYSGNRWCLKKGFSSGTLERKNQAICANLRIDSRESGHLSSAETERACFSSGRFSLRRDWKKGNCEKGLSTRGISTISNISRFSRISENGRILLCFPQSGGSLESINFLNSLGSLENGLF